MTHDLDGNVISKTNKQGQTFSFNYDGNNLLISKNFPGDSVVYNYDRDHLLASVTDADSEVRMEYDVFKRPIAEFSNHYNGHIEYAYNLRGEKVNTRLFLDGADAIDIKRYFDPNGNLTKAEGYFLGKKIDFERWIEGTSRPSGIRHPNGAVTNISYDKNSRPESAFTVFGGQGMLLTYRYTANGNISTVYDEFNNLGKTYRYKYDELSRLIAEDTLEAKSYELDPVGNNLSRGGQFNELNQLLEDNNFTYQYSLNGNLTTKTSKADGKKFQYTWSAENKLATVVISKAGNVLTKTLNYTYDGLGRRITRSVQDHVNASKSYERKFIYDGEHILAILDGSNNFIAGYLYGPGVDEPMGMVTDYNQDGEQDVLTFVKDRQNSVRLILNEKSEVIQEASYSAYGETQILERGHIKYKVENSFYYTSRELESETGDYYYRARYYSPVQGRFLSEDPIGFLSGDANFYRYVKNQPINMRDPNGKDAEDVLDDGTCIALRWVNPEAICGDWDDNLTDIMCTGFPNADSCKEDEEEAPKPAPPLACTEI